MTSRTFSLDHHGGDAVHRPTVGDTLLTARGVYRVVEARPIESKLWPDRWHLRTEKVADRATWDGTWTGEVIETTPYRRGEGPIDHHCLEPACEGCRPKPEPTA